MVLYHINKLSGFAENLQTLVAKQEMQETDSKIHTEQSKRVSNEES